MPGGVAKTFLQTKEPDFKNAFDEWIARVVCFAFSISPQPFVNQMNRATSETQKDSADEEGLLPILNWIKRLCDHVIQNLLGATDIEFSWRHEPVIDPTVQRENLVAYVSAGMMTRKRAVEIMGETLPDDPMADVMTVTTGQGVPVGRLFLSERGCGFFSPSFMRNFALSSSNEREVNIAMEFDQAKAISELALHASDDLNSVLIELLKGADAEKTAEYKKLIGSILGEIYFGILRPVYDLHPDLAPDELKTKG